MSNAKRLGALLAVALLASSAAAVLAACESAAPAESTAPSAAAASTPSSSAQQASVPAPDAVQPLPEPTAFAPDADALEFVQGDSLGSSGDQEGFVTFDRDSSQKIGDSTGPVQGQTYTWEDGDRTLTVYLQSDLVVEQGSNGLPRDVVAADDGGATDAKGSDGQSEGDTLPVFRSESGEVMTLPGGVLLVLSAEWGQAETDAFFADNSIKMASVSELSYATNGFYIETDPGFPSLDLANRLAALDGVEVSSPNWGREAVPK